MGGAMHNSTIRCLEPEDYEYIISVVDEWWGGRNMRDMLPRLFFTHFCQTSFVVERSGCITGFLVGFVSQCLAGEAYIHFVGVHPQHRKTRLGEILYTRFFDKARVLGCRKVRCVTSPLNKGSIAFHRAMAFEMEETGNVVDGVPIAEHYDGPGQHRVLLFRML